VPSPPPIPLHWMQVYMHPSSRKSFII